MNQIGELLQVYRPVAINTNIRTGSENAYITADRARSFVTHSMEPESPPIDDTIYLNLGQSASSRVSLP